MVPSEIEQLPTMNSPERADVFPSGMPAPGSVIADKYVVSGVLGMGGMGAVLSATHRELGTRVAIKVLLPGAFKDAPLMARLIREAQTAAAIQSEHVVRILDVGQLASGEPYLVMEHLIGKNLSELLQATGPLPQDEAVDYILEACEGLAHAHALNIVHRDIKPSNLFLATLANGNDVLKLLDFGISKAEWLVQRSGELTATLETIGTPAYMSPEQARSSKQVDARTDIWAIGVVLYELLCGQPPFWGETIGAIIAMVAADPAPNPVALRPGLSKELAAVILRCLEKDPARRPQTIAEFAHLLAPFASEQGRMHVERIAHVATMDARSTTPKFQIAKVRSLGLRSGARRKRQPRPVVIGILVGACVGVLLALVAFVSWQFTRRSRSLERYAHVVVVTAPAASQPAPDSSVQPSASLPIASAAPPTSAPPIGRPPRSAGSAKNPGHEAPVDPYDYRF
jgi:serine/threonine-protein kinase